MAVVKSCHEKINVPFDQDNIDRIHRIGKKYTDENTGKKVQSMIVKFKSWKSRKEFYDARPRNFVNGKKKPGLNFFNVSVDLKRRRYLLLKPVKGIPILVTFTLILIALWVLNLKMDRLNTLTV